ncbi:hypothetical protein JCM3775_001258 [Rhodotorula graminis]|uniref:Pentacotripeptide-repeat region of PRORP domain-containing protein n=1 Tax=Rhodotorula graminis (strain WP1) TaxID=578459 RepID=A0A194S5K4_RHOGW|nr:uncharacterized protein RHOBADRAFT_53656 [Rhodotorula graminis WP1]KPV74701.1 hypothetical protein RHOBADRAFT_53656 [Rhodotorula graminis WP1]
MSLARLKSALVRLPCTCSFSSRPHPFASPRPSTSSATLDDPLPDWQDLVAVPLQPSTTSKKHKGKKRQAGEASAGQGTSSPSSRSNLSPLPAPTAAPPPQINPANLRRPPNERTQVSPYLPLFTRERNFLLSHLRLALSSRIPTRTRSSRPIRTRRATKRLVWNADAAWYALARVLRYPDDLPSLPHSHFPSSARAPPSPSHPHDDRPTDSGFFTASRVAAPPSATAEPVDAAGRRKVVLTLPELRRAFAVFASARPRTRTGLHRLLVVAELIAQQAPGGAATSSSSAAAAGGPGVVDGDEPDVGLEQLRGGGAGLRDKDWRALLLFVGASMRAPRHAHEVKDALDLFSYWLKLHGPGSASSSATRGRRPTRRGERDVGDEAQQQRMYNAVLFVAGRAKMWELFEQVLRRMGDAGLEPDLATVVEMMRKEDRRGAPAAAAWRTFEDALASRAAGEGVDALWAAMAWVLARRGLLEDAMRLYEAMQAGVPVALDSLRPRQELDPLDAAASPPSSTRPGLVVQPPELNDRVCTALLKAFAYRGDLAGALRIVRDLGVNPHGGVSPSVHHFAPLYHAFAHHGVAPFSSAGGGASFDVNPTTLRGEHLRAHALRRDASPLAALSRSRAPRSAVDASGGAGANPFTLDALDTVLATFLALPAPSSTTHPTLPFLGSRTAPSSKDLWWVLFAFDKLSGGDSELVVAVHDALERKFRDERAGWTGFREDKRTARLVTAHRDKVDERRRRWEELQ